MKALSWDKGRELSWESSLTRTWWFPLPTNHTHPRWHDIEKGQGQGFVLNSELQLKYNILLYSILLQETPPLKFAKKCDDAKRYRADAMRTMIVVTVILGEQFRTKTKSPEWIQFTMNERNKFLGKAPASFITESFFSFSVIAVLSSCVWPNWDHYIQCQAPSVSSFIPPLKHWKLHSTRQTRILWLKIIDY